MKRILAALAFGLAAHAHAASLPPLRDIAAVAPGLDFTCALDRGGSALCWGSNEFGQLGLPDGTLSVRTTPVPVAGAGPGLKSLAAGAFHACAVTASDGVICWGRDLEGARGDGPDIAAAAPSAVAGLSNVAQLSAGAAHTCARHANGSVSCWGANGAGQLGDGTRTARAAPVVVQGLGGAASAIEAGDEHTCAIVGTGVRCWGANGDGALGDNSRADSAVPVSVQGLPGPVHAIAAAARATCAVLQSGAVYCWGPDYPLAAFENGSLVARLYPGFETGWTAIDAGTFHFCALDANGVKCFGDGSDGQLGTGPIDGSLGAERVVGLAPNVVQIAAGGHHSCARADDGGLQCWGLDTKGQLGIDAITRRLVPTQVFGLDMGQAAVSAGGFHSCALSQGGAAKCWGANHQSTIGDGTDLVRLVPANVVGLGQGTRVVSAGIDHTCAINAARRVQCWGSNFDGRLGDGSNANRNVPVDVQGLGNVDVLALALGEAHSCALLQGGAVRCWGNNDDGAIGDGTNTDRPAAVQVAGLESGVTAISAGYSHSCAVQAGALKCWGFNGQGQLGDGTRASRNVPTPVSGLATGVAVPANGSLHSCALMQEGSVKCWGAGFFGTLLGDLSDADRLVPGNVPGLAGVTGIAAGGFATCVIVQAGELRCWGAQVVGDNTELQRGVPTPVAGAETGVTAVDVGVGGQICAVIDGAAKCWAENGFAQVGDGTTHGVPTAQTVLVDEPARRVVALKPDANDAATNARSDASGRWVVFQSRASNLVANDGNGTLDVFRTDRQTNTTIRVSVDGAGNQIAGDSSEPSISADGNLVAFVAPDGAVTKASGLTPALQKAGNFGVYVRNLVTGSTARMGSALTAGTGTQPRISANGNAVAYTSDKTPAGASARPNVYVATLGGTPSTPRCVSCKSVDANGGEGADASGESRNASISADGSRVAFETTSKNVLSAVPAPCTGGADIMLRNLVSGVMQRMSPAPATPASNCGGAGSTQPSLDYAGDTLAFQSDTRIEAGDDNGQTDVYVVQASAPSAPMHVSVAPDGASGNGASRAPELAGDGLTLSFVSSAANLDTRFADNNDRSDVHVATLGEQVSVARLSRGTSGAEADAASEHPTLNYDGTKVAFDSAARTLAGLVGGRANVYQRSNPLADAVKSATWWKSSETGWGLTVFDQGSVLAPAWFTYDTDGEPTWFLTAGAFPQADGSYRGDLLRLTGTPFDRIEGPAVQSATPVGSATLRFQGDKALDFSYTVSGTTQRKVLQPFPYGARTFECTASPTAARDGATNYSDLWTGAGGSAGWGLTVFHVDDNLFAGWYTYDSDGEAVFFVLATSKQADGSFRGPIFRQRNGVPFSLIDGAASSAGTDKVGEATLRFGDGDSATFGYTVDGVTQSKNIVRLLVGSRPSVCQATNVNR